MKNYLKRITSVLLLWSYLLQITVAIAMPLPANNTSANQPSSTYGTTNNSTDSAIPGWIGDTTHTRSKF